MEPKGILLEAKYNFGAVSKGNLYEVTDIDVYDDYKVLWFKDDEGYSSYIVYPTLTTYGNLFKIHWK